MNAVQLEECSIIKISMSFNNSLLTFETMKESVEFDRQELLTNKLFIRSVNKMLSIYQRAERSAYPQRYRNKEENIAITTSGYDLLANIPTMGSDEEGLRVYINEIRPLNLLKETEIGSNQRGYYILSDGKLYLTPEGNGSGTIAIAYTKATTRFPDGQASSTLVPIDQDAEQLAEEYIVSRFYNRENQDGLRIDFEERFFDEMTRYFRKPTRTSAISL